MRREAQIVFLLIIKPFYLLIPPKLINSPPVTPSSALKPTTSTFTNALSYAPLNINHPLIIITRRLCYVVKRWKLGMPPRIVEFLERRVQISAGYDGRRSERHLSIFSAPL